MVGCTLGFCDWKSPVLREGHAETEEVDHLDDEESDPEITELEPENEFVARETAAVKSQT